jgi:hypothetical protein
MFKGSFIGMGVILVAVVARGNERDDSRDPLVERARSHVAAERETSDRLVLNNARTHTHLSQSITAFDELFDELPVFNGHAAVQIDEDLKIRRERGLIPKPSVEPEDHPEPEIETVRAWTASLGLSPSHVELGWLIDRHHHLLPVARVDTEERRGQEPLRLFIHAETGQVVSTELLRWTADPMTGDPPFGAVFRENPITTPDTEIVPLEFLDAGAVTLVGRFAKAGTCVDTELCKEAEPKAIRMAAPGAELVFEPVLDPGAFDDPFAEVNTYWNITTFNHWIRETFGWAERFDGNEWIEIRVGRDWDNAAYYVGTDNSPPYIVFGKDEEVNFAYDADTARHELGHAVIQSLWQHSWVSWDELGIDLSMSGIEEALADILSQTFSGDPVMDAYIPRSRSAVNDNTCPENLYSEGHMEALILSGFGWDVREEIGKTAFEHIVYRSLSFLGPDIDFSDFVSVLEQSALGLSEEEGSGVRLWHAEAIRQKAIERGLLDEACLKRLVPMLDKQRLVVAGYGNKRTNQYDFPFGLQWVIEAPPSVESFKLFLNWHYPLENDLGEPVEPGFRVHVRRGEPVEVRWLDTDDLEKGEPAFEATCDETFEGAPESIGFPVMSMPKAEPGERFYVLFSADTEEPIIAIEGELRFSGTQKEPPPSKSKESAKAPADPFGRSGSCRTAPVGSRMRWSDGWRILKQLFQLGE